MHPLEQFENFVAPDQRAFCIIERDNLNSLRQNYRKKYPGNELAIADDTHFSYILISNFPVKRKTAPRH